MSAPTRADRPDRPDPGGQARLAVTLGDPAGIGPEVVLAALRAYAGAGPVSVYGDLRALERVGPIPGDVECVHCASGIVEPGKPSGAAAAGVVDAVRRAARACLEGEADAVVTAPLSKEVLAEGGFPYPGHTELLAEIANTKRAVMLLVGGQLRVALVTIHEPLARVPGLITHERVLDTLDVLARDLALRFGLEQPRIAVCGLNPHAGEGGRFGREEIDVIAPAVAAARARGARVSGPFAADSLFHRAVSGEFDAVLGMYHDQALGPLKVHAFGRAVNVTLGLPFVRTSVDHGTAFDIAGKGIADPGSMIEALRLAGELVRNTHDTDQTEEAQGRVARPVGFEGTEDD